MAPVRPAPASARRRAGAAAAVRVAAVAMAVAAWSLTAFGSVRAAVPSSALEGAPASLDPAHTVAVIAGVLEWKEPGLPSFSKRHRKDAELDVLLGTLGVPAGRRTVLLDAEATAPAIKAALRDAIAATGPEDTLLFYFQGHGIKHPGGKIIFASADARARVKSGLHLDELPALFAKRFKGRRVVLLADCCYSGGLVKVASALARQGIEVVTLTSAEMSNASTGNWTFTQALLDCLGGSPLCDANNDGVTTLREVREEARDTMLHREQQQIGWANHGVPEDLVLGQTRRDDPALAPGQARRGEWVVVDRSGEATPARVLSAKDGELQVSCYDYSDEVRLTVPESAARPLVYARWPAGTALDVTWNGQVYLAKVLRAEGWLHFITYPGWAHDWDEWVGPDRIAGRHAADAATAPPPSGAESGGQLTPPPPPVTAEDTRERVEVEWQGRWYPAEVMDKRDGKTCIHYVGFDASWDECVPAPRVRRSKAR